MDHHSKRSISVVLPAYNEEAGISETVKEIHRYLQDRFDDFEIIAVSEGSTDGTVAIVQSLQKRIPELKLFSNQRWTGMAGAVRTGFRHATKELIFYTDADRQFDINELDLFLPLIENYDIVTGYKIKRNDPWMRFIMSRLYNITMRLIFDIRVRDINCGFKLYRRRVIQSVDFLPHITEGIVNVEIYLAVMKNGFTVKEVPVHHYPRRVGSAISEVGLTKYFVIVNPRVVGRFIKDTISIWRKIHNL